MLWKKSEKGHLKVVDSLSADRLAKLCSKENSRKQWFFDGFYVRFSHKVLRICVEIINSNRFA
jgi:hypothetical protein